MTPYMLIAIVFAATSLQYSEGYLQIQSSSAAQLMDSLIDWTNAGIDSFGPLAEGPQQAQFIDAFVDWINSLLDTPSQSSTIAPGKQFPSA